MVIKSYGMDKYAINPHKIKSTKEGKCLMKVFFILKWKNWADNIKNPIKIEDTKTKDGNQTPVISRVDNAILLTPTKFLVKSLNPKLLNSVTTLWYLKIHTKATESAIDTCANFIKSSILHFYNKLKSLLLNITLKIHLHFLELVNIRNKVKIYRNWLKWGFFDLFILFFAKKQPF